MDNESLRKLTKELLDILKNAAFLGGIKYFYDRSGSQVLWWFWIACNGILLAYVNTFLNHRLFQAALTERTRMGPRTAKALALLGAATAIFAFVLLSDQTIAAIAGAQAK